MEGVNTAVTLPAKVYVDKTEIAHTLRLCAKDLDGYPTPMIIKRARANFLRRVATGLEEEAQ